MTADFPHSVRVKVRTRDDDRCAKCGTGKNVRIYPRQENGPVTASNAVILCLYCRTDVVIAADVATNAGWVIAPHRKPSDVPLDHAIYGWVTLNDSGTCTIHQRAIEEGGE